MEGNTQLLRGETTTLQWKASDDSNYREHRNNGNDSKNIYRSHESNWHNRKELNTIFLGVWRYQLLDRTQRVHSQGCFERVLRQALTIYLHIPTKKKWIVVSCPIWRISYSWMSVVKNFRDNQLMKNRLW